MPKRFRRIKAKPGELKAAYGRSEDGDGPDIVFACGAGTSKADSWMLYGAFNHHYPASGFLKELERRGYDLTTLKFSIQKKSSPNENV